MTIVGHKLATNQMNTLNEPGTRNGASRAIDITKPLAVSQFSSLKSLINSWRAMRDFA